MGAFEDFLKRTGFVKLDRYGLVLTPDDRILSTRPAVLDDGLGGKIVGWADGDLAAAELDHWGAAPKAAAAKRVAATARLQSAPPAPPSVARPTLPMPVVTPAAFAPTIPQPARPAMPAPVTVTKPAVVAAAPVVEEDEWEWEIAMARARAVADDVEIAAASIATSFTAPSAPKRSVAAPKKTIPMAVIAPTGAAPLPPLYTAKGSAPISTKPEPLPSWPVTETLHETWEATRESPAPQVMSPAAKSLAVVKTTVRALTPTSVPATRTTVIPVPSLPVAAKPSDVRPYMPTQQPKRLAAQPRSRFARGTDTQQLKPSDATVVTAPVMPATEDETSPYVMLPPEVKPSGYAHTKRVAAKHR